MMGKNIYRKHVEEDQDDIGYHPGCLSGVMHAFDYHQWNYFRRINPKKLKGRRSSDAGRGNPHTTILENPDLEQLFDDSESTGLDPRHSPSANKRTLRSRIKVFSKLRNCKKHDSGFAPGQQLQRTYSLHRLEPSDRRLDEIWKNKKSEIIFLPGTLDSENKPPRINQLKKDADNCELAKGEGGDRNDAIEMFLGILPDFNGKTRFTKSGSFPTADMSRKMNFSPSKLENKINEIWVSSEGGLQSENNIQNYKRHFRAKSWNFSSASVPNDKKLLEHFKSLNAALKDEENIEESVSPPEESQQTIQPERIGKNEASIVISNEHLKDRDEEKDPKFDIELDENSDVRRNFIHKKSYSLSDSLGRYARLLEFTSRPDIELHSSRSLKLRNEYDCPSSSNVSFRRINSLSLLDSYYSVQKDEHGYVQLASSPLETVPENSSFLEDTNAEEIQDDTMAKMVDAGSLEDESSIYIGDIEESIDNSITIKIKEEGPNCSENTTEYIPTLIQDSNPEPLEEKIFVQVSESYSSMNLEQRVGNENFEEANEMDSDLSYVRELLARSSFNKYVTNETSFSNDHPSMNDDIFEEMEADWHQEFESEKEDIYGNYTHHQILFDVVNEAILHLHDRTSLNYPKTLSSSCRTDTVPIGRRIREEIITTTSSLLSRKAQQDQSVDDIVNGDVTRDDGWMKLHSESECVALELEDMIADELIEELLYAELVELQ